MCYSLNSDSKSLKLAPSKLLFYGMIKWCCSNDIKHLNLGGGVGSEKDSLYYFKKGFSKINYKYRALLMINDSQKFEEICKSCNKYFDDLTNTVFSGLISHYQHGYYVFILWGLIYQTHR